MLHRLPLMEKEAGRYDPGIFKAVWLAGGPGSGKSYVTSLLRPETFGLKLVNVDILFELFARKQGLSLKLDQLSPQDVVRKDQLRELSWTVLQSRLDSYIDARLGVFIDGTGRIYRDIEVSRDQLRGIGYECMMIFVNTSLEVAMERNSMRDRSLSDDQVKIFWHQVQQNIGKFQQLFGGRNFAVVDNTTPVDDDVVLPIWKHLRGFSTAPLHSIQALEWVKREDQLRNRLIVK